MPSFFSLNNCPSPAEMSRADLDLDGPRLFFAIPNAMEKKKEDNNLNSSKNRYTTAYFRKLLKKHN